MCLGLGSETEPSPDWRRSHSGVFLQLSWRDRSPLRSPGRVEQSRGTRCALTRPHTGGLGPLSPLDRPMVDAAARWNWPGLPCVRALVRRP